MSSSAKTAPVFHPRTVATVDMTVKTALMNKNVQHSQDAGLESSSAALENVSAKAESATSTLTAVMEAMRMIAVSFFKVLPLVAIISLFFFDDNIELYR
jgi:hypothetical protein